MFSNNLDDMLTELSRIKVDWGDQLGDGYSLVSYTQVWGNTSGGFEGWGGSALTEQRTYVFINTEANRGLVFFGSTFAYSCTLTEDFLADVYKCKVCGVSTCSSKYKILEVIGR